MSVRMTFIDLFMAPDPIKKALKAVIISNPTGHNSRDRQTQTMTNTIFSFSQKSFISKNVIVMRKICSHKEGPGLDENKVNNFPHSLT